MHLRFFSFFLFFVGNDRRRFTIINYYLPLVRLISPWSEGQ